MIPLLHNSSGFFFLDKIYWSAVCMAFKIFRFSSNSNCWHGGIKYLRVLCYGGIYIGNDNVEDDESPSSSPKCQKKIDLFF